MILCCQEKHRREVLAARTPQTDTGDQVENTKAIERIMVKELGKMPPVTSGEGGACPRDGDLLSVSGCGPQRPGGEATVY